MAAIVTEKPALSLFRTSKRARIANSLTSRLRTMRLSDSAT